MKIFYLVLCIIGTLLPYWQFFSWIGENGMQFNLLISEIIHSRISAFAWLDVIISAVALLGFIAFDGRRLQMKKLWLPVFATLSVGVSLGLPLFLLLKEIHLENTRPNPYFS